MRQLDVFWDDVLVGYLKELVDGSLVFFYDGGWLASAASKPLSPDFPLDKQVYVGEKVVAYFDNLLPEGTIRDFIASVEHISPTNVFGLLERFGGDTAGAICLLPKGQKPSKKNNYLPISVNSIKQWFASSRGLPLNVSDGQMRASLSGAQDKMSIFIDLDGHMMLPLGDAPSSHIIKPSLKHGYIEQTAINEMLIMTLAKEIGLNVPDVQYKQDLDAIIVRRYDREITSAGTLKRLHQNDICQILGISSKKKYEAEGGPSFCQCLHAVLKHSNNPIEDKLRMIEWLIFNLAVGNMDSHAKNISLLTSEYETRLAPFYDMVCTVTYQNLSQRFAFKIGGENRPGWLRKRHWERFSEEVEVPLEHIDKIKANICKEIEITLPIIVLEMQKESLNSDSRSMIESVCSEIRRNIGRLRVDSIDTDKLEEKSASMIKKEKM